MTLLDKIDRLQKNVAALVTDIYSQAVRPVVSIKILDRILRPEGHPRVAGVYAELPVTLDAIRKIKEAGFDKLIVHSPAPSHEIEEATGKGPSIVRYFTLVGAVLGACGGFALASWTSLEWNLVVSGKPIVSIPAFLVITFECTILLGGLATFIGMFHSARLPQPVLSEVYQGAFGDDMFGIGIVCDESEIGRAEQALAETGAVEVCRAES